ncbi:hypothetical protein V8C34DRAFT_282163 [Trichoderma compactum]
MQLRGRNWAQPPEAQEQAFFMFLFFISLSLFFGDKTLTMMLQSRDSLWPRMFIHARFCSVLVFFLGGFLDMVRVAVWSGMG